ncbi:MAG TPA: adenylate/guanylate cyclase domain-containing protein, partial [Candidatus Dormibacteraeota bacterium]|nr:adenylate/guanylate cyclase domain-containing protein [Candidatus Dormibacteraeota bacterium]
MPDERRLVTVLFADVVGSTSLGEERDPEDVRALLARLFAIARDAVEQRGGRVEKFIGDAVMAVFGVPRAHDDDAARALSAALDLRDRVRADPLRAERVPIRIGVNTGEVIASGDPDATESLVTGDAVNAAARLQQAADPWAILVGDRAVRASGDRFRFGPLVPVAARGRSQPVAARVLEDEDRLPSGLTASRAPLVGRAAALEQLELAARRAFEEARPYLVSIVAPAGVGKSRLLEAFLGPLAPDVRVALAQCLPYGQRLTYWPMRAILLSVLGLGEESAPDAVRAALSTWLQGADESEPERTAELLAATIGGAEAESGDRLALFAAWRRFIELAAERTPLVLVIEDLHWSSDSLLDLIEAILQPRSDVPLLMIALARPELLDRRPGWSGGRRNAISLALEPLADGAVRTLVANLLEAPSPGLTDAVVARAEGNPFYAGEIVRALADRLGPRPDPAAVSAAITALPDTVQATVLARLDMLEPRPRRIVQLGAVMGRTFSAGALATLDPVLDEEAVVEAVDVLIDRDLVRPSGRDQLTFRHILIREVAYGMLPRAERARLHARAGAWLEGQALRAGREEELAELVAFHFREAATLARLIGDVPDPSLAERAVTWLRRAADVADAGAASPAAARHLQAAIELASREAQPDLYERLGQVWIGGEQGLEAFERAHELGRELGLGPDQQLRTIAQLAVVYSRWRGSVGGRLREEETTAWLGEIERLLDRVTTDEARILGYLAIGFGPNRAEHPTPEELASSRAAAEKALELARRADAPNLVSAALDALDVVFLRDDRIADT